MTTNPLIAEWTEQNEEAVRAWARAAFNKDSIVEQYLSDLESIDRNTAISAVYYNANFSDTLFDHGVTGGQEDVALEEWEALCGLFGIVEDDEGRLTVKPGSDFAKALELLK